MLKILKIVLRRETFRAEAEFSSVFGKMGKIAPRDTMWSGSCEL